MLFDALLTTYYKNMTQELYQKAMRFAGEKHAKQTVPGSKANYLLHISNVTMEVLLAYQEQPDFNLNFAVQLAILHDTIEDTDTTVEELSSLFGSEVASGVLALTKNDALPEKASKMQDSLNRILQEPKEVALVKLADRITNMQAPPQHWPSTKVKAYHKEAQHIAQCLKASHQFLYQRLISKIEAYPLPV